MLTQDKKFLYIGHSTMPDGTVKVRFANDMVNRSKTLQKRGNDNIDYVNLPNPMTKLEALLYLKSRGNLGADVSFAVDLKIAEKTRQAKKKAMTVTATSIKNKNTEEAI